MSALLEIVDLHVAYGKVEAVHGVSLTVDEGSIVTVIGPNGAGKTTLLAAIMGLLPSPATSCTPAREGPASKSAWCSDFAWSRATELFAAMTVADNLELARFNAIKARSTSSTRDEVYQRFPRLAERRARPRPICRGERQMPALGRALMATGIAAARRAPASASAPLIVKEIFSIIAR
jgi:branched-chain amino acid transport system ATP-binding protein